MVMTNLFAWRDTDPAKMKLQPQPIGERRPDPALPIQEINDWHLINVWFQQAAVVVACWGTHGAHLDRAHSVAKLIPGMKCFGRNEDGSPKHPLYLPKSRTLTDFN